MKLKPGKHFKDINEKLIQTQIENPDLTKEEAIEIVKNMKSK